MMRLQPDMFSYLDAAETPLNMRSVCLKFMAAAGVISAAATALLIIFNLGLRRRETGILSSVGIRNRSISAKYGFEYAIFIAGVAALSAGAGYLLAKACLASAEWLIRAGFFVNADASVIVFCAMAAAAGWICAAVVTAVQLKVFSIPELLGR
jgi:ABC-type antimicrobial peptide transport system permease subunit